MNPVDGRLKHKEKTSAKPVVHSPIGSFGQGVQFPLISTSRDGKKTYKRSSHLPLQNAYLLTNSSFFTKCSNRVATHY